MQDVEEEKSGIEIQNLKRANREKDELIKMLKGKIVGFESEKLEFLDDRSKLAKLFELGLIDSEGDPIYVEHPDEREAEGKEELMKF